MLDITLYGDSISKGIVFDEKRERYAILKNNYATIANKSLNINVMNRGKFGSTILKGAKRLLSDIVNKKPDVIIIEFGGNDCDFDWKAIAKDPSANHLPNTDFEVFSQTLKTLVEKIKEKNIVPVLMSLPPLDAEKYYSWVKKLSDDKAENILKWLGGVSKIYWWHEKYNAAILKVALSSMVDYIDIRSAFLAAKDYRNLICIDGIHPNEKGHELIASTIVEYVKAHYSYILTPVKV